MSAAKPKVLVAMSGGVDSSVAAALLVRAGYEVVGCFMRLGTVGESLDEIIPIAQAAEASEAVACSTEEKVQSSKFKVQTIGGGTSLKILHRGCCSISDAADARLVAAELGIPLYVCNFKSDFGRIIDYFVDEYASGRTPNPCIRCNDWLKFGKLHDYAARLGCDYVASGHYARIATDHATGPAGTQHAVRSTQHVQGTPRLLRAVDHSKDQSYVLFGVPRKRLASMLLPIGEFHKTEVRDMARRFGLPVFDKPDSQEICFVPDDDYAALVERRRPELAAVGAVVGEDGAVLGEHRGQHRFTIGQRRGLGNGVASGERLYVTRRDPATNTVTVGRRQALASTGCIAGEANWLMDPPSEGEWRACIAKYRYNTPGTAAEFRVLDDQRRSDRVGTPSGRLGRFEVRFSGPQLAVAPGQAVVLYSGGEPDVVVLGGGWIERAVA